MNFRKATITQNTTQVYHKFPIPPKNFKKVAKIIAMPNIPAIRFAIRIIMQITIERRKFNASIILFNFRTKLRNKELKAKSCIYCVTFPSTVDRSLKTTLFGINVKI